MSSWGPDETAEVQYPQFFGNLGVFDDVQNRISGDCLSLTEAIQQLLVHFFYSFYTQS